MEKKILYIEQCDFISYPMGGTLSFAKQFVKNIENELLLVGFANEGEPIGVWYNKTIEGRIVKYFAYANIKDVKCTKMPKRLFTYFKLKKYISLINQENVNLIFTQTPQFVFLISKYKWEKFCFSFAGLGNSVELSKFKLLRKFGGLYEKKLFEDLKNYCDVILAAADNKAIDEKILKYNLKRNQISSFPTRFDDDIFYVQDKVKTRQELNILLNSKIIITTGRLSYIKGWKLLIDSFRIFKTKNKEAILIFIGEGEEKLEIIEYCKTEIDNKSILLVGRKNHHEISKYINAADIFVMASLVEGWPTSMVEALACGKNIVSTDVSGASEMIDEMKNGHIVYERDPALFADAFSKSLNLPDPNPVSIRKAKKYAASSLNNEFHKLCLNDN